MRTEFFLDIFLLKLDVVLKRLMNSVARTEKQERQPMIMRI